MMLYPPFDGGDVGCGVLPGAGWELGLAALLQAARSKRIPSISKQNFAVSAWMKGFFCILVPLSFGEGSGERRKFLSITIHD